MSNSIRECDCLSEELPGKTLKRYFTVAMLVFLAAFLFLPNSKLVNTFYYGFIALPALVVLVLGRVGRLEFRGVTRLWLALFVWIAASGSFAGHAKFYKDLGYVVLFCLVIWRLVEPRVFDNPLVLRSFFWGLASYVVMSVVYFWVLGQFSFGQRILDLPGRLSGPIFTSMLLVVCYARLLPLWWESRKWLEGVAGLAFLLLCVGLVLQSRSGLVGIVALFGFVGLFLISYGSSRARAVFFGGASLLLLTSAWFLNSTPLGESLVTRADSHRLELWSAYLREWDDCGWLLGCGYSHAGAVIDIGGEMILHPHNIFLTMGFYGGLLALGLFIVALFSTLMVALRQRNPWGGVLLLSLVMLNFDGQKIIASPDELWLLVWLPAMLIVARVHQERNDRTAKMLAAD
ncbi:O-antigen ligase [Pseudomonas sp. OIL-1]|uniref:O-antigen ligase family protein n=1 Tax=Pseudomonas sp. OIL-1 TaxID=2706126 RepID=UPI0013A7931A|nr:O-antigen ligase family protein [Pseudomonas sp. OIL-1]QIB52986.1 O-antigen ligase family protein [Pseudomonas sp. OIL-1]